MYYKVTFKGFAYVEADSPEEAEEALVDGMELYMEYEMPEITQVDECTVIL